MNRRDALKSLTALAGATGISVTPVTTHEATDVTLMILRTDQAISQNTCKRLVTTWMEACRGTALQDVKTIVLADGIDVEFVRSRT